MNIDAIVWVLNLEAALNDKSGIYGYMQRTLAYNSNKIEGSLLTKEQTATLFEEGYLPATDEFYKAKDIEEMSGHFLMFNKMLATLTEPLTEQLIKQFHYELKAGVFEDRANGYAIGDYKQRLNTVGGLTVTHPARVHIEMKELIEWFNSLDNVTMETIAELHARYELIHPFQDGNGRTGRVLLFRECLRHDLVPFIIHDDNRILYVASLRDAQLKGDYTKLTKLFESEQQDYLSQCAEFDVFKRYQKL